MASGLLAAALLLASAGCGPAIVKNTSAEVAADRIEWAFTQADQHPEERLISVIRGAERTLDIAIYSLTYPGIVGAIRDAAKRGVAVRLLTDRIQSAGKTQKEALKLLGSAGVPIKINRHSGLMHLKLTVADRQVATTGSFNYSKAASTTNDEMLVVIRDSGIASAFADAFDSAWEDRDGYEPLAASIAEPDSPSSAGASADGQGESGESDEAPAACETPQIKGNINSRGDKLYHVPGGASYERTKPEAWFCSEAEAKAAGYRKAAG